MSANGGTGSYTFVLRDNGVAVPNATVTITGVSGATHKAVAITGGWSPAAGDVIDVQVTEAAGTVAEAASWSVGS